MKSQIISKLSIIEPKDFGNNISYLYAASVRKFGLKALKISPHFRKDKTINN